MEKMSRTNTIKLVSLAYCLTFVTGIGVILPFVLKVPAAQFFHSNPATLGYAFSAFMVGMLLMEFLNGYLVEKLSVRTEIIAIAVIYAICGVTLLWVKSIWLLAVVEFIMGLCFGANVTLPNFMIVHSFDKSSRSSHLNRLDFFFSLGSFIYPMIAAYMLTHHCDWQWVYLSVVAIFLVIVILAMRTKLPNLNTADVGADVKKFSRWNLNVYLIALVIFFFLASYIGFTYWVVEYSEKILHLKTAEASLGLTLFWIFYAVGCFISSILIKKIRISRYIIISGIIAFISYFLILKSANAAMFWVSISVLGLGCATIYSSSISFGTLQVENASPRMVGLFVTASGVGTMLAEVFSSFIESNFGLSSVIIVSAGLMLICTILTGIVSTRDKSLGRVEAV